MVVIRTKERQETVVSGETQNHKIKSPPQGDEWVISLEKKLQAAADKDNTAGSWEEVSIYRVPHHLRDPSDHGAYTPQVVSLGPYHHDRAWLKQMERHKWRALQCMLHRNKQNMKTYADSIKELEKKARARYEGPLELKSNHFKEMMLLDGCFILEILQGAAKPDGFEKLGYGKNDPIFSLQKIIPSIQRDMMMLENQIPLFVLDELLRLQDKNPDQQNDVAELAIDFFKTALLENESQRQLTTPSTTGPPLPHHLHILDVVRSHFYRGRGEVPSYPVAGRRCQELIHCVTELVGAGIRIKKRKTDRLWDIEFDNGTLYIPQILIHDGTKSFLQNLIAFEQCHPDCKKDITSYVVFLDSLIDTTEDVRCLHYHGIIERWLGSDAEVANLVNCLGKEVVFDTNDSYLCRLFEKINTYYHRRWNTWRATLNERYFNSPWAIISLVAAAFLLMMTAAQTFYGVYGYYWPNN